MASWRAGPFDVALAAAYEVHALAEACGQPGPRAQAHNTLGICVERMGDPWQAERPLRKALSIAREGAPLRELFGAPNNLCAVLIGTHYLLRGSELTPASLAALERALPLAEEMGVLQGPAGEPYWRIMSVSNLGKILVHLGDRDRSHALLDSALTEALRHASPGQARERLLTVQAEAVGLPLTPMTEPQIQHALYQAHKALGDTESALRHLERQSELLRERIVQQLQAQSEQFVTRVEAEQYRAKALGRDRAESG